MSITLPEPYVTSRIKAFSTINDSVTILASRVEMLGGGLMTVPLPIVGGSEDTWGTELNTYLIQLEGRVTVVETTTSSIFVVDNDGVQVAVGSQEVIL